MKNLIIVRHAKSAWDFPELPDFERPLNKRGKNDAPRMAKKVKEKRIIPDTMISSPALRALTTCTEFAEVLGFPKEKITTDRNLYHADEEQLLQVVRKIREPEGSERAVMIFGHNPGLTDFVNLLLGRQVDNIPTCGIVAATLHVSRWSEAEWGCGKMLFFDYPKLEEK